MTTPAVPAWDAGDFGELIAMDALGPMRFRTRCGDANEHGRSYGGQILAQALMAAARTVPPGDDVQRARLPSMKQFLFLQGTLHAQAIDLTVTTLQDGKRFSSRHVRGMQGDGRAVLDAQVTFAQTMPAPAHDAPPPFPADEDPERLPSLSDLPSAWGATIQRAGGYTLMTKPGIDFRIAAVPERLLLDAREPRLRSWVRLRARVGDAAADHAAALAYLSDWWVNYPALGAHLDGLSDGPGLYVASLNHSIWWHRRPRADQWLHVESVSPAAGAGRGFNVARLHDRAGQLVASVTQECLMAPRQG
ncbi:MAG: thioesterase family protein [Burkholderiaceae bacterium]